MPSSSSTSRMTERGSRRTSSTRMAVPDAPARPMMPCAHRHGQAAPRLRAEAVGGHVVDGAPVALRSPMPQPVLPMRSVTARLIASSTADSCEARRDELGRPVERGQRLGAAHRLPVQPRAARWPRRGGAATSPRTSTSASVKRPGSRCMTFERADHLAARHQRDERRGTRSRATRACAAPPRAGTDRDSRRRAGGPAARHHPLAPGCPAREPGDRGRPRRRRRAAPPPPTARRRSRSRSATREDVEGDEPSDRDCVTIW